MRRAHQFVRQEVTSRASTRHFKQTVADRIDRDPDFAQALLDEAAMLFLNGEPGTARLILCDRVDSTTGFEQIALMSGKPRKSQHRMLSPAGNPSMDKVAAIFHAVRASLIVNLEARCVAA